MPLLRARGRRGVLGWAGILVLLVVTAVPAAAAEDAPSREALVKAAFLLNFARFVEWPPSADPITIGVLGPDPFQGALEAVVTGEQVKGRALRVVHGLTLSALGHVDILYCVATEHLPQVLASLDSDPVLTVADLPDFCQEGGIIQFVHQGTKLRFTINDAAARHHHLHLSAQLLSVALPWPMPPHDGRTP